MISVERIATILAEYELTAPRPLCEKVHAYIELLLRWNERVALTTITDPEEIVREHFAESFLAAKYVDLQIGRLADVGSGAGFPGLALKIYCESLDVTLIEPIQKKTAFLHEASRVVGANKVEVQKKRFQEIPPTLKFNFITSRALGQFEDLLGWSKTVLNPDGIAILWIGEASVTETKKSYLDWTWRDPFHLPHTKNRYILAGSPKP
jgi:16S rRNA (guanine527-N7)-methyltransferase